MVVSNSNYTTTYYIEINILVLNGPYKFIKNKLNRSKQIKTYLKFEKV